MGLLKEGITEVIATTRGNAAPMGIILRHNEARMVVYRQSHTAARIASDGWLVANFIFDPCLYVKTAFDDLSPDVFVREEVDGIIFERLSDAEAWIGFRAEIERTTPEALFIGLHLLHEAILAPALHPINRGFNGIIEATIHATRWKRTPNPELARLIIHHAAVIRKCGGKRELEALALLLSYISDFQEIKKSGQGEDETIPKHSPHDD